MRLNISLLLVLVLFSVPNASAMNRVYDIADLVSSDKDSGSGLILEIPLVVGSPCLVASVHLGLAGTEEIEVFALAEMGSGQEIVDQVTVVWDGAYVFDATRAARYAQDNDLETLSLEISDLMVDKVGDESFQVESGSVTVSYHSRGEDGESIIAPAAPDSEGSADVPVKIGASVSAAPNPFNPSTTFKLTLEKQGTGAFNIYDLSGKKVRSLHFGPLTSGEHEFFWNGRDESGGRVSSGLYMYQYSDENQAVTGKVILLK